MASDLSSGCTDAIEVLDEREEGEISLEDVSSSEEGHVGYGYGIRATRCINCLSTQRCASWCTSTRYYQHKSSTRKDAVQEKENRHYAKDSGSMGAKHTTSTLQEKNDDLVPISSDSDMEIVGLMDNSKQLLIRSLSKSRNKKKKKKKRTRGPTLSIDDLVSSSSINVAVGETTLKNDNDNTKNDRLSRSHHRDLSPTHRSVRSRGIVKSPSRRHRTWMPSPVRKSRSPITRTRSPALRRSPRRVRSPKRSPYRSPSRTIPKKISKNEQSSPLSSSTNVYGNVDKLLRKVRQLDSVGLHSQEDIIRNREHSSSLKEKLSNMMKGMSDNNGNVTNCTKEKTTTHVGANNDADDEDDLALLRQKALETKQKRVDKNNEQTTTELENKTVAYNDDDHDEEDLELRMIALRSAVLKKHQNRVQRGVKSKKHDNSSAARSESPFTQSFLDSIPIPSEKTIDSPPPMYASASSENTHTEDMELDTDVEREKEKLPYSPTDNITTDIPIDTELLGIQPSDVSFIHLDKRLSSPPFDNTSTPLEHRILRTGIIENKSYLPNMMNCTDTESMFYETNADAPYSPSDSIETSKSDITTVKHCGSSIQHTSQFYSKHCNMMNEVPDANGMYVAIDITMSQERPYSPTDAPMCDPDLSQTLPLMPPFHSSNNSCIMPTEAIYDTSYGNSTVTNTHEKAQLQYSAQQLNISENKHIDKVENVIARKEANSPRFSETGSVSPNDSIETIDDLLDADAVTSSVEIASQNVETMKTTSNNLIDTITKLAEEPLYMQGVPDVTKDANKIPTLINRTLVPASILKSNKQLQQPLPTKKHESQVEPAFKSAEMQPVSIDFNVNTKCNTQFKPMKLASVTKKSQTILATPIAFQGCLNDDAVNKMLENTAIPLSKEVHNTSCSKNILINSEKAVTINNTDSVPKKRKRTRRGGRRRSNNALPNVNNKIANKKIEESKQHFSIPKSGETSANAKYINIESQCSDIPEKRNNMSNMVASTDSSSAKLKQSDSDGKTLLLSDENCIPNKASVPSNEIRKQDITQHPTNLKTNVTSSSPEVMDKTQATMGRRPSLDEDEDALRAILLASLTKRTKPSDIVSNNTPSVTVTAASSNVVTVQSVQKAQMSTPMSPHSIHQTVKNDTKLHSLIQSVIPHNVADDKNHAYAMPVSSSVLTKEHAVSVSTDAALAPSLINPSRKRPLPMPKGPARKFVKKAPIPASTKVVNNAKKYQNTVIQRKLILQKAASIHSAEKLKDTKPISNATTCENKWLNNAKPISSDTQRIVINLGSDTESDSEHENLKANSISATNSKKMVKRQILTIPTTDFEKSVDQFLRDVRKKQETAAASKQITSSHNIVKKTSVPVENKISPAVHTPLAVRHLPVSKQEEYRRLKQQILEREMMRQRSVESGTSKKTSNTSVPSHSTTSDDLSKEPPRSNSNDGCTETERNIKTLKSSVIPTSTDKDLVTNNVLRPTSTVSFTKTESLQVASHLNVQIFNEVASNQNNAKANIMESNSASLDIKSMSQSQSLQETTKFKADASLKVLTKDELNHKFVQIQVKQHESGRVVTINNKTSQQLEKPEHCIKYDEKIESNESNRSKEDNISVKSGQHLTEQQSEINETNNLDTNETSAGKIQEERRDTRPEETVPNDINNLNGLNVKLLVEHTNIQGEEAMDTTNDQSNTSIQDSTESRTSLNISDTEITSDKNLLFPSNSIEENKITSVEELWESIKKDIATELHSLVHLPRLEQERHLMDTEQRLVTKRYTVLDDLAEMSGDLRQWDMERDLQTNLVEEVKKLREQLKVAEEKLRIHRNRVNSIGPKVMAAHEKINSGRRECFKLSRICMVLGTKVVGQDYKIPQAGANLLDNKLKEVANHTRKLSKKKVPSVRISDDYMQLEKSATSTTHAENIQNNLLDISSTSLQVTSPVVSPVMSPIALPMEKEAADFEHSLAIQQDDSNENNSNNNNNNNNNNNTIAPNHEDVLILTSTEKSSELKEDKEKKDNLEETNDIVESDYYCDRTSEAESCCSPATLQDCDINRCTEAGSRVLKDVDHQKKITIEPYVSMLAHLKVPRNTNPNGVLCPYELMGTCNDGDCQFVHQSTGHVL